MNRSGNSDGGRPRAGLVSRMICESLNLRVCTVESLHLVRELSRIHAATPVAALLLGRLVNATALMGAGLKPGSDQNISVRMSGNGPIREIHVQADARGNLRGYVGVPGVVHLMAGENTDLSGVIGAGVLTVVKDLGLKEPYRSVTPLRTGDIAMEIARYLTASEQVPSAIILGLSIEAGGGIDASGGILVQTLPGAREDSLAAIERNIASMRPSLAVALKEGASMHAVVSGLLGSLPMTVLESTPLTLSCRCGREMLREILKGIEAGEPGSVLADDGRIEITCTFCTKRYYFTGAELSL